MQKFIVGLDLGQANDYTALSVVERLKTESENTYHVRHLERVRGVAYPDIVAKVTKMMHSEELKGNASLVIDQTGCGRPVFDMFRQANLKPIGISIHGGDSVTHELRNWRVPKRDLVGVMQVLLQSGRLKIASKLALKPVLLQEMQNFKVKIDPATAHDNYSAWREGDHDDLVLAVALACWYGQEVPEPRNMIPNIAFTARRGYDPFGRDLGF
jgi:phage terminase large subunit-like protein